MTGSSSERLTSLFEPCVEMVTFEACSVSWKHASGPILRELKAQGGLPDFRMGDMCLKAMFQTLQRDVLRFERPD